MWIIHLINKGIIHLPQHASLWLIRLYQRTISPDHSWLRAKYPYGYCKFNPSCSEYGYQSIAKHGFLRGGTKTVWRVLRCNPWSKGGVDPVE